MSDFVKEINDSDFDADIAQSDVPVILDFWAPWCGPCRMIAPILDEVANEYSGRLKAVKMNVDDNSETPEKFGVRGIPTLIIFKGGEVVGTKVGGLSKAQLVEFVESNL